MSNQNTSSADKSIGKELDIIELLHKLWGDRKTLFYAIGITLALGLILAFSLPKQYKVTTTMLPQSESGSSMGGLSSLAAIAGFDFNLSDEGSEISPIIYPQILESAPFMLALMHSKYTFKGVNYPVSMYEYITKIDKPGFWGTIANYTIGLPNLIKKKFQEGKAFNAVSSKEDMARMNEKEYEIAGMLRKCVVLTVNKKEGYLTLTTVFDEDILTAQVAKRAQQLLQEEITRYKTKRATDQLVFIENRYLEKKADYQRAQARLASYQDRNMFMTSAIGSSEETRLRNEYNLALTIYTELAKQYENASIKVKKVTPAYIIIKPVVIPNEPFAPRRKVIVLVSVLLGLILGSSWIFVKYYLASLKGSKSVA